MNPDVIHKSIVQFKALDRSSAAWDATWKRSIGGRSYGAAVSILGQVQMARQNKADAVPQGDSNDSEGYVLIHKAYLASTGYTPRKGDRIVAIDGYAVEYDVHEVADKVVYGPYSGPSWTKVTFKRIQDEAEN